MKMLVNRCQQRNDFTKAKYWSKMLAGNLKTESKKSLNKCEGPVASNERELWGEEYQVWKTDCIEFSDKLVKNSVM